MNYDKDYLMLLWKSYGSRPISRREWDSRHENPRSSEVIKSLNKKNWYECLAFFGCNIKPYNEEDIVRYGKAIGIDIAKVTREQWDKLIELPLLRDERIPSGEDIIFAFGNWKSFQSAVKIKPSVRRKQDRIKTDMERLFIEGLTIGTIANRIKKASRDIEEHLKNVGLFTPEYIAENFSSVDSIIGNQIMNIKYYGGEDKKAVREMMISEFRKLGAKEISYCGLSGVNFIDYVLFAKNFNVIPERSLVAECDKLSGHVMLSVIRNWNCVQGGEIFRRLKIYLGKIEDALKEKKYKEIKFNVVNFDWVGGWAKDKYSTLRSLFQNKHVADESIIFMSLNDSPLETGRAASGRGYEINLDSSATHITIAKKSLEDLAVKNEFKIEQLFEVPYRDTVDMLAGAYLLKRDDEYSLYR